VLKLRRGVVVAEEPLTVEVDGDARRAWADERLLGEMRRGDEVVVNTAALDLGLGSGGFDVVHVNLTRGLDGDGAAGAHVMKLNYASIQHPVELIERREEEFGSERHAGIPVLVIPLHGHLAPATWAAREAADGIRVGYVQTAGGALPGRISRDVAQLRSLGLLCGHVTAAPAYGGELEALSVAGALDAAAHRLGWDAAIAGPGPGIIGSETRYGHGGMAALDNAQAALALGMPTMLSPRLSEGDPRARHRGVSRHTSAVLELLLAGVVLPVPEGAEDEVAALAELANGRHELRTYQAEVDRYAASGLPTRTMGRDLDDDRLFFAAALAAGRGLADAVAGSGEDG
jgi:Protein of unknown function (DUF3866)